MFSLEELKERISAYAESGGCFDDFADWYRRGSRGKFGASAALLEACMKVDMALSKFYFDSLPEEALRLSLLRAIEHGKRLGEKPGTPPNVPVA